MATAAPARRQAGTGARWTGARRFGPTTLVVAGGLALLTGMGSGAALAGVPWRPSGASDLVLGDAVGGPQAPDDAGGQGGDGAGGGAEVLGAPHVPDVAAAAAPARPEVYDLDVVGPDGLSLADRDVGLLSREVPAFATGELVVVPGSSPAPHPDRPVRSVRVEVEAGLAVDGELFAATVMATLNDPRSWGGDGSVTFARTDGPADIRVVLASPQKVDAMCAPLTTDGRYSCGRNGHAAINHDRWVNATEEYLEVSDVTTYRRYVVNHEVGHLLGHQHRSCPAAGERAHVMQQQSVQVAPCTANAWPFPDAPAD